MLLKIFTLEVNIIKLMTTRYTGSRYMGVSGWGSMLRNYTVSDSKLLFALSDNIKKNKNKRIKLFI